MKTVRLMFVFLMLGTMVLAACEPETVEVTRVVEKEVEVEVEKEVEVTRIIEMEVETEVTVEVLVEKEIEVTRIIETDPRFGGVYKMAITAAAFCWLLIIAPVPRSPAMANAKIAYLSRFCLSFVIALLKNTSDPVIDKRYAMKVYARGIVAFMQG